jgi:excisionase family DNA binding protein
MATQPNPERLLTAQEVGEKLSVSRNTILDWHQSGTIPSFKLNGKAVRFRLSEVEAWLLAQRA